MATSSQYYGTSQIAQRTRISSKTVLRFIHLTRGGPRKERAWWHFDKSEFEDICGQIEELQKVQPHHPLRALAAARRA